MGTSLPGTRREHPHFVPSPTWGHDHLQLTASLAPRALAPLPSARSTALPWPWDDAFGPGRLLRFFVPRWMKPPGDETPEWSPAFQLLPEASVTTSLVGWPPRSCSLLGPRPMEHVHIRSVTARAIVAPGPPLPFVRSEAFQSRPFCRTVSRRLWSTGRLAPSSARPELCVVGGRH